MSVQKTNAMRILDNNKITYNVFFYENRDGKIDGISVANKIGKSLDEVYKTLVVQGNSKEIYVLVIPVEEELDLKKAAKLVGEKEINMILANDINKYTGYIRGGCSPIGMKKSYKTFINDTAETKNYIIVSGGKIGVQIEISPLDLIKVINGKFADLIK